MADFNDLPNEVHLELLHHVATESPENLLTLIQASRTHMALYQRWSRNILHTATAGLLLSHPQFVRDALQASCSDMNMILNAALPYGEELKAWTVQSPAKDVWTNAYTGDRVEALENLVFLNQEIQDWASGLLRLGQERNDAEREIAGRLTIKDLQRDIFISAAPQIRSAERQNVVVALWLQESMRFRNANRAPGAPEVLQYLMYQ